MNEAGFNPVASRQPPAPVASSIVDRIVGGDIRTLSRCISAIENGDPAAPGIVDRLYAYAGRALVIGVTGVPGAGKSTLVSALAERMAATGARPAILAVDPSSPISGGALLGDRIRHGSDTEAIFFRSVASRGSLGGLSRSLDDTVTLLEAAGRDPILIETVGTGQSEIAVTQVAHTTLAVTAPGLGDEIQAMKAGITEVADLHIVNKSDTDPAGAEASALVLRHRLADSVRASGLSEGANAATADSPTAWLPPVRVASAQSGAGVGGLLELIQAHRAFLESADGLGGWRRRRAIARYHHAVWDTLHAQLYREWRHRLDLDESAVADGKITPVRAAQRLVHEALLTPPQPEMKDRP
jgi:LAO/AO transport system kinase